MLNPGICRSLANENLALQRPALGLVPLGRVPVIEECEKGRLEVWKEGAPLSDQECLILLQGVIGRHDGDFNPYIRPGHRSRELTSGGMARIFPDLRCLFRQVRHLKRHTVKGPLPVPNPGTCFSSSNRSPTERIATVCISIRSTG